MNLRAGVRTCASSDFLEVPTCYFGQEPQTAHIAASSVGRGECRIPAYTGFMTASGGGPKCPIPKEWPFSCKATVSTSIPGRDTLMPQGFPALSPLGSPKVSL